MVVMSRNMTRRSGEGEERVDLPPNQLRLYVNPTGDRWSAAALKDTLNQMMNPILRSMQRTEERERAERERAEGERAEREGDVPEPEAAGTTTAAKKRPRKDDPLKRPPGMPPLMPEGAQSARPQANQQAWEMEKPSR